MRGVVPIVILLVFAGLWALAWRRRRPLAIGILVGVVLAGIATVVIRPLDHIPLWLPPLPFALVACSLFFFGALAWYWGSRGNHHGGPR